MIHWHNNTNGKTIRVAQWAAGRIGQSAMRAVIRAPSFELVGLHVHSADKVGKDAGELCGLHHIGVAATSEISDILLLKPDVVLYTPEGYDVTALEILLGAGINVITTRNEFFYPEGMVPELRSRIEAACQTGNSSLLATGSSPGFSTIALPLVLTSLSREVECIIIDEFADIPASVTPSMITDVMGFGSMTDGKLDPRRLEHASEGFSQTLQLLGAALGQPIEEFVTEGEVALATASVELANGAIIKPGTLAAQRITVSAMAGGRPILKFRANWYCTKDLDREWVLGDSGWRVQVDSDTPLDVSIEFPRGKQNHADQMSSLTAHPVVNAIPFIVAAPPGIRTAAEFPVMSPWHSDTLS
mgnify:CR=1 FL=1